MGVRGREGERERERERESERERDSVINMISPGCSIYMYYRCTCTFVCSNSSVHRGNYTYMTLCI